jgi:hypothetical protein
MGKVVRLYIELNERPEGVFGSDLHINCPVCKEESVRVRCYRDFLELQLGDCVMCSICGSIFTLKNRMSTNCENWTWTVTPHGVDKRERA